jgi:hypothetical protein
MDYLDDDEPIPETQVSASRTPLGQRNTDENLLRSTIVMLPYISSLTDWFPGQTQAS